MSIPKIYQCKDTTKVQLGEMVNYLGVIFRNIDEVLHIGADMTQGPAVSPKATQVWETQYWEPGTHCAWYRQLKRPETILSRCFR